MIKKDFEKMKSCANEILAKESVSKHDVMKRGVITKDDIVNLKILLNSDIDFETFIKEC